MHASHEEVAPLIFRPGIPAVPRDTRKPYQKQLAVYIILASILLERIAFYTLAANLALNLETGKLDWSSTHGLIASSIFSGTSYISTILFAVISDAKLGRAKTIIVGFFLYLVGYIFAILVITEKISECTQSAFNETSDQYVASIFHEQCADWILATIIIIAIGSGAVQSTMAVLGAEQIQETRRTSRYFDKYVVAVNIGGIIALSATPYTSDDPKIYRDVYIAAACVLFAATLLFLIGYRYYIHFESNETVITKCIPVVRNAFQSWYQYKKKINSISKEQSNSSASNSLDASHSLMEEDESTRIDERPSTFLDFAKLPNGKFHDRIVNDVKSLRRAFVVFILLIPYWLIYNQVKSTFRLQTQDAPESGETILVIIVSLADPITIIIGVLILKMFVYKYLDARNRSLTIMTKFVIGMCFASLTMSTAGIVESFRQKPCDMSCSNNQSDVTIFAQLPQNIFMGISELFATVASFEFAYFTAPRSAQTLFMSLLFCSAGIASFIDAAYVAAFSTISSTSTSDQPSYQEKNPNLYAYFFILGGLQLIFIIIFIVCQKKFRIIKLNPQQMETNQLLLERSSRSSTGRH